MNIRHTFGVIIALVMLPFLLLGSVWYLVKQYTLKGYYLCELFCEELDEWADEGNK